MMRGTSTLFVLALLGAGPSAARADETCVECHRTRAEARLRAPVTAVFDDVHGRAGVLCSGCHGGDPDEPRARAHDLAGGFVGRPDPLGTVRLCGRCHAGSGEAPAVGEAYRRGAHGVAVANGRAAAICTSCHGAHGIEPGDAPPPPMICASCHADPERMALSRLPTDQLEQWSESVHGQAAAGGNRRAPTCASCHQAHDNRAGLGASHACGGCHEDVRDAFESGPHVEAFARLGFLDCVECHGSHEVAAPDARLLSGVGAVCTRCHGRGQPVFERVRALAALGADVDRARALTARNDPERRELIAALHRLDASAVERAIAAIGPGRPDNAEPDEAGARTGWIGVALLALALVSLTLFALALRRRRSRRRG